MCHLPGCSAFTGCPLESHQGITDGGQYRTGNRVETLAVSDGGAGWLFPNSYPGKVDAGRLQTGSSAQSQHELIE
jgi:hypothetical protein